MSVPRRRFLKSGALAAVAVGLLSKAPLIAFGQDSTRSATQDGTYPIPYEAKTDRVFYFTKSTFDPYLDTDFTVRAGVLVATLRLIEVEACGSPAPKGAGECFSLTFRADRTLSIARTIHTFDHYALGKFDLFVSETKMKNDPDTIYYVAVINHRTEAGPPPKPEKPPARESRPKSKPGRDPEQ